MYSTDATGTQQQQYVYPTGSMVPEGTTVLNQGINVVQDGRPLVRPLPVYFTLHLPLLLLLSCYSMYSYLVRTYDALTCIISVLELSHRVLEAGQTKYAVRRRLVFLASALASGHSNTCTRTGVLYVHATTNCNRVASSRIQQAVLVLLLCLSANS